MTTYRNQFSNALLVLRYFVIIYLILSFLNNDFMCHIIDIIIFVCDLVRQVTVFVKGTKPNSVICCVCVRTCVVRVYAYVCVCSLHSFYL